MINLIRCNDNWNKVESKDELTVMLEGYRGILSESILTYLNSLVDLEFSVVVDKISDSDRKALSELEVYKRIAIYNIYNRTQEVFSHIKTLFNILNNERGAECLSISHEVNDKSIRIFEFDYGNRSIDKVTKVNGFTNNVGVINLYHTVENAEMREKELERLYHRIKYLSSKPRSSFYQDNVKIDSEISHCRSLLGMLEKRTEITENEKLEVEVTRMFHDMLFEEFGLTEECFEEEFECNSGLSKSFLQKRLIRKTPSLAIVDNIKYV